MLTNDESSKDPIPRLLLTGVTFREIRRVALGAFAFVVIGFGEEITCALSGADEREQGVVAVVVNWGPAHGNGET